MLFKDYTLFGAKHLTMFKRIGSGNAVSNYLLQIPLAGVPTRFNYADAAPVYTWHSIELWQYCVLLICEDENYRYLMIRLGYPGIAIFGDRISIQKQRGPQFCSAL